MSTLFNTKDLAYNLFLGYRYSSNTIIYII